MARDTSPIVKQSRREGYALHPKAHKIMARKSGIPGEHAHSRQGKPSLYLTQLREKQKVRRTYGLLEKQFARLMKEASRKDGLAGENLLQLLERRLDNVVYRAGFATSRRAARQLVSPKSTKSAYFTHLDDVLKNADQQPLSWMKAEPRELKIAISGNPKREEAEADINEQLIVEYYSR